MDMFDEVKVTKTVNGKPYVTDEETILQMQAKELEEAIAEFLWAWKQFQNLHPESATDYHNVGLAWWKTIDALALGASRFKEAFIQGDRSPNSIRCFHRFMVKMLRGERYSVQA